MHDTGFSMYQISWLVDDILRYALIPRLELK